MQKDLKVGQFQEREALPVAWWRQLAELAVLLILVGVLAQGCDKLPPNVWPPADCRLWQTAIQAMPDGAARDAAQAEFDRAHPEGCPVEPTSPPTTEPPSPPPPSTLPPGPPPTTLPPPPEPGCTLAGAPSTSLPNHRSTLGSVVNAVLLELHPECGYAGGSCVVNEETQQGLQRKVEAALRARGICAGQHEPWTDEIAVAREATDPWEGYRVFSGDDTEGPLPPGAPRRTIQWAPPDGSLERPDGKGGYRAAWLPPVPTPTPTPTATPDSGCGAPVPPPLGEWGLKCWEPRPGTTTCDATPKVRGRDYCASVGYTDGRNACAVRPDCDPATQACRFPDRAECEVLIVGGLPVWEWSGDPSQYAPKGPYTVQVSTKSPGVLRVCNPAGTVCNQRVQK